MFIATLIAADRLTRGDISAAADVLAEAGCAPGAPADVESGTAADIPFTAEHLRARTALEAALPGLDVVVQPAAGREKKLLVADMDSTMITVECIDELADYAGVKAEIAAVTERAMQGELDFESALDARVALLEGLEEAMLDRCYAERVQVTPGAKTLVRTMRARGGQAVLVSGGFTHFADRVAAEIGFDRAISNRLTLGDGKLLGTVERPIVGAEGKRLALLEALAAAGLDRTASLAVGDGANDIPMLIEAGLGVAYRAKPRAAEAADARIEHGDLSALLFAQGVARRHWAE